MTDYRFARDFEVLISEPAYGTLSREAGFSTPGEVAIAAADIVVKAAGPNGTLLSTYVEAEAANADAALTEAQLETAGVAASRDQGDGFAIIARLAEVKTQVVHWPASAPLKALLKASLESRFVIAR